MKAVCAYPNSCNEAFVDDVPDLTNVRRPANENTAALKHKPRGHHATFQCPTRLIWLEKGVSMLPWDPAAELIGPPGLQALPETTIAVAQDTLSALEEEAQNAEQGFSSVHAEKASDKGAPTTVHGCFRTCFQPTTAFFKEPSTKRQQMPYKRLKVFCKNTRRGVTTNH